MQGRNEEGGGGGGGKFLELDKLLLGVVWNFNAERIKKD
jgi:hypothetical protein